MFNRFNHIYLSMFVMLDQYFNSFWFAISGDGHYSRFYACLSSRSHSFSPPPLAHNVGRLSKFFYSCPDNAFQAAWSGTSFSLLQRLGAINRNEAKLLPIGTTPTLVGTIVTNALINARKAVDHSTADEVENVHVLSTSVGYVFRWLYPTTFGTRCWRVLSSNEV